MKNVVVIGGGFAGAYAAKHLQNQFTVTLIDTKDYFEFTPSILRTIINPEHRHKIQVEHTLYLPKGRVVKGQVVDITEKEVVLENGQKQPYDYVVVCAGSGYNTPFKNGNLVIATRAHVLKDFSEQLKKAVNILIIGGGIVGVEMAGEILEAYPAKNVTIVHSKDKLMHRSTKKAQAYAEKVLKKADANIIYQDRVIGNEHNKYSTQNNKTIIADLAFMCTGITPSSHFFHGKDKFALDDRNHVVVNEFLQMKGHKHIFATGDITDIKEEKTAQNAEEQAKTVVENIKRMEKGNTLKKYEQKSRAMIISIGTKVGILTYKNFTLTGKIPAILKDLVEKKTMKQYTS